MTNLWDIMAPYAILGFAPGVEAVHLEEAMALLPGVKKKDAGWAVPHHALHAVAGLVETHGANMIFAKWVNPLPATTTWDEVEAFLRASGEVADFVLDGFLTQYQKDAITHGWNRTGVHFWHGTGSGKTLTGLMSALSVQGPIIIATRAASRLQYAREVERFTTLKAYVVRPETEQRGLLTVGGRTWVEFFREVMPKLGKAALVAEAWKQEKAKHGVLVKRGNALAAYLDECKDQGRRPVIVVGWESLPSNLDALMRLRAGAFICDELHNAKNSKRWDTAPIPELEVDPASLSIDELKAYQKTLNEITKSAKKQGGFVKQTEDGWRLFLPNMNRASAAAQLARTVEKRIGTTATPVKDRVRDLWSQLDIIEPNAWGNKTSFESRHCDRKPGAYGGFDTRGSSHLVELKERLNHVAHILKYEDTHKHLPPKRRQSVYIAPEDQCNPSSGFAQERKAARNMGAAALLEVNLAEAASRKRTAVVSLLEEHIESGHKVTIFTGRRRDCEALGKSVLASPAVKNSQVKVWVAHGEDSQAVRDRVVREYMEAEGPCVLVGTGQAFGEALNIDTTDAAFFVMLPYTPGQLRQWEGRFHRASTKRPIIIYYIIAEGTVDEHMASILIDKLPAVQQVVEDNELASAAHPLSGINEDESEEEFARSILADLDFG